MMSGFVWVDFMAHVHDMLPTKRFGAMRTMTTPYPFASMTGLQLNGGTFHTFTTALGYCLIASMAFAHMRLLYSMLLSRNRKNYDEYYQSPMTILLLVITSSNYVSYALYKHLPISTWGEGIVQLTLYIIISNLMLLHHGRHKQAVAFTFVYVIVMMAVLLPMVPGYLMVYLKLLNLTIKLARNVNCVYRFHKQGSFTQDPLFSSIFFLDFCSFGRLLTAAVNAQDPLFVVCYCQDCVFSGVLTIQSVVRKRKLSKAAKVEAKTKRDEKSG